MSATENAAGSLTAVDEPREPDTEIAEPSESTLAPREAALEALRVTFKAAIVAMRRMRGRESRLHGEKLTYAQFGLLFAMQESSCVSARELAQSAALTPGTVTQMLDGLEAAGLVERTRSTEDKRVVHTELTDRGRQLLQARRAQIEPRWRETLSQFSDEELHTASNVMQALADYFDVVD